MIRSFNNDHFRIGSDSDVSSVHQKLEIPFYLFGDTLDQHDIRPSDRNSPSATRVLPIQQRTVPTEKYICENCSRLSYDVPSQHLYVANNRVENVTNCIQDFSRFALSYNKAKMETNAIKIQSFIRGFIQRLKFRIVCLQAKLDAIERATEDSLKMIGQNSGVKVNAFQESEAMDPENETPSKVKGQDSLLLIFYLHGINQQLSRDFATIKKKCMDMKCTNERLEALNANINIEMNRLLSEVENTKADNRRMEQLIQIYKCTVEQEQRALDQMRRNWLEAIHQIESLQNI